MQAIILLPNRMRSHLLKAKSASIRKINLPKISQNSGLNLKKLPTFSPEIYLLLNKIMTLFTPNL
jgi:hypothetical protein